MTLLHNEKSPGSWSYFGLQTVPLRVFFYIIENDERWGKLARENRGPVDRVSPSQLTMTKMLLVDHEFRIKRTLES